MKHFFSLLFVMCISVTLFASHVTLSLTGVANNSSFYYCSTSTDSVIVYKPTGAGIGDFFSSSFGYVVQDSLIITAANQGNWIWEGSTTISFNVYFVSTSPTEPWTATNISKCPGTAITLTAQSSPQPDFLYLWSGPDANGSLSNTVSVTTPGTYSVTVTGACASMTDEIVVTDYTAPTPNLGADRTSCDGTSVLLDPGVFSSYSWSIGSSASLLTVTTTGTYSVTVSDANGCTGSDAVTVTFLTPPYHPICYVEFDTITLKNRIQWATPPANAENINIYSEISTNTYSLIGTVPATQTSYTDMTSNPQNMSNSYKISVTDTCGNEGNKSAFHKTITLLSTYDQPTNTYGFTWSAYEGLTVANYLIFGITGSGQVMQIGSVPGNSYFYNYPNPSASFVKYYVGFYTPTCGGNKTDYIVRSNYVASTTGMEETSVQTLTIYPNPATNQITISGIEPGGTLRLYDLSGKLLLERVNRDNTLELVGIAAGSYVLEVRAGAESGSEVVRGRVVVE